MPGYNVSESRSEFVKFWIKSIESFPNGRNYGSTIVDNLFCNHCTNVDAAFIADPQFWFYYVVAVPGRPLIKRSLLHGHLARISGQGYLEDLTKPDSRYSPITEAGFEKMDKILEVYVNLKKKLINKLHYSGLDPETYKLDEKLVDKQLTLKDVEDNDLSMFPAKYKGIYLFTKALQVLEHRIRSLPLIFVDPESSHQFKQEIISLNLNAVDAFDVDQLAEQFEVDFDGYHQEILQGLKSLFAPRKTRSLASKKRLSAPNATSSANLEDVFPRCDDSEEEEDDVSCIGTSEGHRQPEQVADPALSPTPDFCQSTGRRGLMESPAAFSRLERARKTTDNHQKHAIPQKAVKLLESGGADPESAPASLSQPQTDDDDHVVDLNNLQNPGKTPCTCNVPEALKEFETQLKKVESINEDLLDRIDDLESKISEMTLEMRDNPRPQNAAKDLLTYPQNEIVFNGPFDGPICQRIKVCNAGNRPLSYIFKVSNLNRVMVDVRFGVLGPQEYLYAGVSFNVDGLFREEARQEFVAIEWTHAQEGTVQFDRDWFYSADTIHRKILNVKLNP